LLQLVRRLITAREALDERVKKLEIVQAPEGGTEGMGKK
jgi:hypothetical protein